MTNVEIVRRLRRKAAEYARKGGNLYRVRAYRQAAFRLSSLPAEVADLGPDVLKAEGIGEKLANTVYAWALDAVEPAEAMS